MKGDDLRWPNAIVPYKFYEGHLNDEVYNLEERKTIYKE
jgi:hypothetical protein